MLRKFIVFISASALTLMLFLAASTAAILNTTKPSSIKAILSTSKVYDNVSDIAIEQIQKSQEANMSSPNTSSTSETPFDDPAVQEILRKTFTPVFIKTTFEKLVDGTTPWLTGDVQKPTFIIDLNPLKASFADNLGIYAESRIAALPTCAKGQIPASLDVLSINCIPKGFGVNTEIQKAIASAKTSQDFLPTSIITADSLKSTDSSGVSQPLYQKYKDAPMYYQLIQLLPLLFGILAVISAISIIFVSRVHRKGIRKVAINLMTVGLIIFVEVFAISFATTKVQNELVKTNTDAVMTETVNSLTGLVRASINHSLATFGAVYVGLALFITGYMILTRKKHDVVDVKNDDFTEGSVAKESKPASAPDQISDKPKTQIKVS